MTQQHAVDDGADVGFTLVELLVSLTLLSLIAVYALYAFSLMNQMKKTLRQSDHGLEVIAVQRQFDREVGSLTPFFVVGANGAPTLVFEGQRHQIEYAVVADGTREVGGLYGVKWLLDQSGNLVIKRKSFNGMSAASMRTVVLQGVKQIDCAYQQGQPDWIEQPLLPTDVHLKITFEADQSGSYDQQIWIVAARGF